VADVLTLKASFILDSAKFKASMNQVTASARSAAQRITTVMKQAADRVKAAFAAMASSMKVSLAGVAVAATAAIAGFSKMAGEIDRLAKFARQLDIPVGTLQELESAAGKSGISADELRSSLEFFQRSTAEALQGTGPLADRLRELGINAEAFAALPVDKRMEVFADAIAGMGSQVEKSGAIADAFGRSGQAMLNLFADGSKGIQDLREQFRSLGTAISDDAAAGVEEMNDAMQSLREALSGFSQAIVAEAAPGITQLVELLTSAVTAAGELRRTLVEGLANSFVWLGIQIRMHFNDLIAFLLNATASAYQSISNLVGVSSPGLEAIQKSAEQFGKNAEQARREYENFKKGLFRPGNAPTPPVIPGETPSIVPSAPEAPAPATPEIVPVPIPEIEVDPEIIKGIVGSVSSFFGTFKTGDRQEQLLQAIRKATEDTARAVGRTQQGVLL
jgi:hypothetical protein